MKKTRKITECAVLIAIATVLSLIKLVDLPYGGSITAGSMLPMVILAYRHGLLWGLGSGLVYGAIQQLTGLNTLSWVTTWQSVVAVILLDYVIAFAGTCFGGLFRKKAEKGADLALGALIACLFRYACHVISGATVWAGLSIPDAAALTYSFAYNATYMLPETIVLVTVAYYLGSMLDFEKPIPVREAARKNGGFSIITGAAVATALIADTALIFAKLQDSESGEFDISNLAFVNWTAVGIITAVAIGLSLIFMIVQKNKKAR